MIPANTHRWLIWTANIAVFGVLYALASVLKLFSTDFVFGILVGYLACWTFYACWRVDDKNDGYARFEPEERHRRFEQDRARDPRI